MFQQQIKEFNTFSPSDKFNTSEIQSIKSEMSVFLGLLQKSIDQDIGSSQHKNSSSSSEKKLSTILSASQENSSNQTNPKKENLASDKYQSRKFYQKYFESDSFEQKFIQPKVQKKTEKIINNSTKASLLSNNGRTTNFFEEEQIKQNKSTNNLFDENLFFIECSEMLNPKQLYLLDKFKAILKDYKLQCKILTQRNQDLSKDYEKFKTKNQNLMKILTSVRGQERKLLESYSLNKEKAYDYQSINRRLVVDIDSLKSENIYLKELIFLANSNYQNLERKLLETQSKYKHIDKMMKQKKTDVSQNQNITNYYCKNDQSHKSRVHSPMSSRIEKSPDRMDRKNEEIQQSYRRMFIKTLKTVKK